jgi:hypothetical protein
MRINPAVITTTAAGTATATAVGANRIRVNAPYTNDGNANNTLLVEYKLTSEPTVWTTFTTKSHTVSPYDVTITGLNDSTSYDVRVTYQDGDGVTGTPAQTFSSITTPSVGVEAYGDWSRVINDSTTRTAGTGFTLTGSYTVPSAASSRYLVVAITQNSGNTSTAPAAPTSIYFGSSSYPLTLATTNRTTSSRAHTWLYYLKDTPTVMDGTSKTLTVAWSAGIAANKIDVYCQTFSTVDQSLTPVNGSNIITTNTTTGAALSAAMNIAAKGLAIYVLDDFNGTNTTIPTWTPNSNWTSPATLAVSGFTGTSGTYSYHHELAQRVIPATATTDAATTGTRSVSSRYAMSAMVLPMAALTLTNGTNPANQNVYAPTAGVVVDNFVMTGTVATTVTSIQVTGNANTTSTNISAIKIYKASDNSLIGTGYFGSVGTTPVDITLSTPQTVLAATTYYITYDIAPGAIANGTLKTFTGAVTALTPTASSITDTGATITLRPTTTIGTGTDPATARLPIASAATNMDAFTLQHTGTSPTDDEFENCPGRGCQRRRQHGLRFIRPRHHRRHLEYCDNHQYA